MTTETNTVEAFAARVLAERQDYLRRAYPQSDQWEAETVEVKPGTVYTKVNVGPTHNMSGKYMVENATGIIFGIKAYGKVHKGHRYGTLDTIEEWDWSGYTGQRRLNLDTDTNEINEVLRDTGHGVEL